MPRGQKSKLRARKKRQQARGETKSLGDAQGTAAEEQHSSFAASPISEDSSQNLPAAETGNTPKSAERAEAVTDTDSVEGAKGQIPVVSSFLQALVSIWKTPLEENVTKVVDLLLDKYFAKEPITKIDMLTSVNRKYKYQFPEMLKKASVHLEVALGVDLKEVDPIGHSYVFVNILDLTEDNMLMEEENMPKTGLLMVVLGLIFMKHNCATEEEVWEMLNVIEAYPDKEHIIYGEPKKVITQELVQMQYLEYRQVANSDPPRYEFLWGPRAHAEITKMKVLEFVAKVHNTTPSAFPSLYEEALKDEEERVQARIEVRARSSVKASACCQTKFSSSSCSP